MSWFEDLIGAVTSGASKATDVLKDTVTADGLKGTAAVASAIGQYQSTQESKRQFNELMDLKLADYNHTLDRQNQAQNAFDTGVDNVFGAQQKKKVTVDCTADPTNPACLGG